MARRLQPLSARQVEILRWVADGCPDGVWEDFTYKHTVYALAERGLVIVDRRRDSWSAQITAAGRYYLQHGTYQTNEWNVASETPQQRKPERRQPRQAPRARPVVSAADLVADLQASHAPLTVPDPPAGLRAAYRRAISHANTDGVVPDGYTLRYSGRDRGDLVVRLVSLYDVPVRPEPLPPGPVPTSLEGCHPAVQALRDAPDRLQVSPNTRDRALLILQAIAAECVRREWKFAHEPEGASTFQVTVDDDTFDLTLVEESDRQAVVDRAELARARYDWQRVPSILENVGSGRLQLRLDDGYRSRTWADRQRWRLDDKLPAVFKELADRAEAAAAVRARRAEQRRQRRAAWEQAVVDAKQAYVDHLNRERLDSQVADAARADAIRAYAERLDTAAASCADDDRADQIRQWARWARAHADNCDPLAHPLGSAM